MRTKLLKSLLTIAYLLCSIGVYAHDFSVVTTEIAKQTADNLLALDNEWHGINEANVRLVEHDGVPAYYVVEYTAGGWIIVSAQSSSDPIIGYNTTSKFIVPVPMQAVLDACAQRIVYEAQTMHKTKHDGSERALQRRYAVTVDAPNVEPLIKLNLNQEEPFNKYTPQIDGKNALVGSVAVAMSQAMMVQHVPVHPIGNNSYKYQNLELSIDYNAEPAYNWDEMHDSEKTGNYDEVARLLYHTGVSVNTMYSLTYSGAYISDAVKALKRNFSYDKEKVKAVFRSNYSDKEWYDLILTELMNGRAVIYQGAADDQGNGGHCWNIDGWKQSTQMVHCNWGWGGYGDGYFSIDNMTDSYQGVSFLHHHAAIIGIGKPSTAPYGIDLSSTKFVVGVEAGVALADITVVCEDKEAEFVYELFGPKNLTGNYSTSPYEVVDGRLVSTKVIEDKNAFKTLIIKATNANTGESCERQFTIQIVTDTELEIGNKFIVDGIHYEVMNESGQVAVTYFDDDYNNLPAEYKYTGSVVIPNIVSYQDVDFNVISIGEYAFRFCEGLTSITIPESVTSIDNRAFEQCTGLKVMDVKATTPPTITYNTFEGVDKSIPVYVPAESGEAYRAASYWREFTNIIADNHLCAESVQALKLNGVLQLDELTLPVSMINDVSVLGVQCDIELPDGLTAVAKESGYDITLSERAANYSVSAKLREDGLLRVLIYPNNTTNPIAGNEGELFAIKLQPNEQYDSNDKIVLRNIELTITQFNTLYARDFTVDCTIKESILGDSNRDKKVNVTDLSQMALYVNATEGVEIDTDGADADRNGVVESNDIDSVGNMVVAGSADATQNVTTPDAESPNYLQAEDMDIVILDGALLTQSAVLPIALTNTTPMMGVQCDVAIPAELTLLEDEAGVVITPSERLGEGHVIKSAWLSTDSLRVLIYSPTATAIAGTNGTLFSLQLQVAESYEPQTTLSVTNITIASQDAQEYNAKALNVSCTITESTTGDCNQDGRVNVSDLVIVIYNILGVDTGDSNMIAADVNQDGELNVTDVVELVALILNGDNEPRKAPAQEDYETGTLALADTQIVQGTTHEVGIELNNTAPYTAFQMDVTLPECLTIEDVVVSNRTNNHSLQWREQADGTIRIVGYSLSNEAIGGEGGTLLNLVLRADNQLSEGVVEINGITFVTRDIVTHQLDKASGKVSVVTGLNNVVTATRIYATDHKVVVDSPVAQEAAISTIDGMVQRVDLQPGRNEIPLQQGVYIVAVDAEVKKVVIR